MADCTCDVRPPRHEHAYGRGLSYAIYLDQFEDETVFDPDCPFHGDGGSMVRTLRPAGCACFLDRGWSL
jgi:hypothetical protein